MNLEMAGRAVVIQHLGEPPDARRGIAPRCGSVLAVSSVAATRSVQATLTHMIWRRSGCGWSGRRMRSPKELFEPSEFPLGRERPGALAARAGGSAYLPCVAYGRSTPASRPVYESMAATTWQYVLWRQMQRVFNRLDVRIAGRSRTCLRHAGWPSPSRPITWSTGTKGGSSAPSNKGMKLTKLSAAWLPDMDMPPHARAGRIGRGHRFAAYPRCSTDVR